MTESPAVQVALAKFNAALATRKTTHLLAMEKARADSLLEPVSDTADRSGNLAMARSDRFEADLEDDHRPLIFRGMLIAMPFGLLLWWLIYEVVR